MLSVHDLRPDLGTQYTHNLLTRQHSIGASSIEHPPSHEQTSLKLRLPRATADRSSIELTKTGIFAGERAPCYNSYNRFFVRMRGYRPTWMGTVRLQ